MAINLNGTGSITGLTSISSPTISGGSLPGGDASAPGLTFSGDPNTGIYSPGADQVAISTNGTGRLFVDSSGNVGLNSTPVSPYGLTLGPVSGQTISLLGLRSSSDTGNSRIDFGDPTATDVARIQYEHSVDAMVFRVNAAERLRITSDGKVGLGTSDPGSYLSGSNQLVLGSASTGAGITIFTPDSSAGSLTFAEGTGAADNARGQIKYFHNATGANGYMQFLVNTAPQMTITTTGVGVGTTSPGTLGDADYSNLVISGSGNSGITVNSGATSIGAYAFNDAAGTNRGGVQYFHSNDSVRLYANGGLASAYLDSSGRLLVGTSSGRANFFNFTNTAALQVEGTTSNTATLSVVSNNNASGNVPVLLLGKTRGATVGSNAIVQNGDLIGYLTFQAADGTDLVETARIETQIDGIPGANDMPGRLVFSTTADGASSPTERMRIGSNGKLLVAGTNDNGAYNIQCNGTGVWGFGAYVNGSDKRLKENINPLPASLDVVKALNPVAFQYKPEFTADTSVQPGFIAQELQTALADQAYVDGVVQAGGQYLNVAYQALIPVLTKALQEAIAKIETLEAKVAALESA